VNISRALAIGDVHWGLLGDALWMALFTAASSWVAIKFIKRRLVK
jgi:hypothetical protein